MSTRIVKMEKYFNKLKIKNKIEIFEISNENLENKAMYLEDKRYTYLKALYWLENLKLLNCDKINMRLDNNYIYFNKLIKEIDRVINKYPLFFEKIYKSYFNIFLNLRNTEKLVIKKLNELKWIIYNKDVNFKIIDLGIKFIKFEINYLIQIIYLKLYFNIKKEKNLSKKNTNDADTSENDELPLAKSNNNVYNIELNNRYIKMDKDNLNLITIKNNLNSFKNIKTIKENINKNYLNAENIYSNNNSIKSDKKILRKRNTINIHSDYNEYQFQKLRKQKTFNNNLINYFNFNKKINQNYWIKSNNKPLRRVISMMTPQTNIDMISKSNNSRLIKINTQQLIKSETLINFDLLNKSDNNINYSFFYKIENIKKKKVKTTFNPFNSKHIPPEECGYIRSLFQINFDKKEISIRVY